MDNHDGGISVYSEAKGEYTKQLTLFIVPAFHRFFMDCLDQAATEEPQGNKQLWKFQEILSQIPEWNIDKVQREILKITGSIQCDYLEELVTAVFIAHTKVLTAIRIGNKNKRVQITIPKLEHYLHRALSECSRLLWSSAYLFHNDLAPVEKQKNHRQIEQLLHEGIGQAIRGLLPVKNILKDYLSDPNAGEEADDEGDDAEETDDKKETPSSVAASTDSVVAEEEKAVVEKQEAVVEPVAAVSQSVVEPVAAVSQAVVEPVAAVEEKPVAEAVVEKQVQTQPLTPTFIVDTEPSVRFTNFDQVIQQKEGETQIGYVEKQYDENGESIEDEMHFNDSMEPISDFEDLTDYPLEQMTNDDFEVLS